MAEAPLARYSVVANVSSSMATVPPVNSGPCLGRVHVATEHVCATSTFCVWSSAANAMKAVEFVACDVVLMLVSTPQWVVGSTSKTLSSTWFGDVKTCCAGGSAGGDA